MVIAAAARAKRRLHYLVQGSCLTLAGLATLALALYPMYVLRPLPGARACRSPARPLGPVARQGDPVCTFSPRHAVRSFCLAARGLGGARWLLLTPAMGIALIAAGAAWFNPYEQLMFHPFGEPRYVTIQQAGIDPKDMVIAVTLGGESRAYPIREMGYHHVVNDRLHQLPIVVTY